MSDQFDWGNRHLVAYRGHGDLAVFLGPTGDVVVRQRGMDDGEDSSIVVPLAVVAFIAAEMIYQSSRSMEAQRHARATLDAHLDKIGLGLREEEVRARLANIFPARPGNEVV